MQFELPMETLVSLLLASVRVAAWLVLAPPFSHRSIPARVKALLAFALALAVMPDVPESMLRGGVDSVALTVATAQEVVVGSALGFLCMVVFAAVQSAGDLLDLFGGFQMGILFDPQLGVGSAVMGRTYYLTSLALLFSTDAHLLVLRGLLRTFDVLPLGQLMDLGSLAQVLTEALVGMFLAALQIAGPIIGVLFLADVGLGLLTRIAPALNAFAIGFPLKILITLIVVGLAFQVLPQVVVALAEQVTPILVGVAGG